MKPKSIRLSMQAVVWQMLKQSTRVKVVFTDHGPGIEDIEKAMEEGYSTASYEIRQLGFGAGMGLSNIKSIQII